MKKKLLVFAAIVIALTSAIAQTHKLQFYKSGSLVQSVPFSSIDSVKVGYSLSAPTVVNAQLNGNSINVSWTAVSGATSYQVYRSGDNKNYSLLAGSVNNNSYTDASPLKGANFYKIKAVGQGGMQSPLSIASAPVTFNNEDGLAKGLYMGIIGFNTDLYDKGAMSLLTPDTKSSFTSFVNNLSTKMQTLLYFGIDKGLEKLMTTPFPRDLRNVAIVTFTDGLDLGSPKKSGFKYPNRDTYREGLANQVKSLRIQGLSLSSYTIGLRGGDVDNDEAYQNFKNTLEELANPADKAKEIKDMAELDAQFQRIAKELTDITRRLSLKIKTPIIDAETLIRFTFDNVSNASQSQCYIEGTLNGINNTLTNVKYVGLTCESGTLLQGTEDETGMVEFFFENVRKSDGAELPQDYLKDYLNEYYWNSTYWQVNQTEFRPEDNLKVIVTRASAAIMLVLDCSKSLDKILEGSGETTTMFKQMKSAANNFINTLAAAMEEVDPGSPTNPSNPGTNGHEYVDLGLPSGLLWATCNVGASKPEEYGNYYAWGETSTKSNYSWSTYKYCNGSNTTMTKYCNSSSYGTVDNKTTLELSDDVARASWGGSWRMPTIDELSELNTKCTWIWTSQNGKNGYKVTGPNGNSIFLPAAGDRYGESLNYAGSSAYYWSSSLLTSCAYGARSLGFNSSTHGTDGNGRYYGQSVRPVMNIVNDHEYVDLGLPSGLLWATCNVGASKPEEYGNYYAWGETSTKSNYSWSTYKYCNGSSTTMTKYCNSSSYGTVDNKTTLEPSDDVARASWGGSWRMPTIDEFSELNSKCTWTWTSQNGKNGYKVTGPNGNSIFLPAAGYRDGESLDYAGSGGDYWSSSLGTSYAYYARELYFNSSDHGTYNGSRCYGRSVRPVTK